MRKSKAIIWWLGQQEAMALGERGERLPKGLPKYIRTQFHSRYGRAGRCRLWHPGEDEPSLPEVGISPWPENALTAWMDSIDCGGIIIRAQDAKWVIDLPGFLTDAKLNRLGRRI